MWNDIRFGARMLAKTPVFTAIATLALALGIGASTTMYSVINALLIKPLPLMPDQDRLLYISEYAPRIGADSDAGLAYPDFLDLKKQATTLDGIGASTDATMIITEGGKPDRYLGSQISADSFSFLGVKPVLGRLFHPDEDKLDAAPVALLGYGVWVNHFGADRTVVGRVVTINNKPTTIVGVMPKGWRFPKESDLWMPLQIDEKEKPRGNFNFLGFGKLKKGVSMGEARAELQNIAARLAQDHPQSNTGIMVRVTLLRDELAKDVRSETLLLMGAVLFVHLIACANVANLLLARAATRTREIAIRLALGASRRAIIRQLLGESLLLSIFGSALGLIVAVWGIDLLIRAIPVEMPYWLKFDLDWRVFGFALLLGIGSAFLFGLFPALQASRPQLLDAIKQGGRSGIGGGKSQRVRNGLVIAEVALALVLLVSAGLMLRSFLKLQSTNFGVDPSHTLTFRVGLPPSHFKQEEAGQFFAQLMAEMARIPGVETSTAVSSLPASGDAGLSALVLEGEPEPSQLQNARLCHGITIAPGYLATARIPLLRGRAITAVDSKDSQRVALIDETAARTWFPGVDPVGHQLRLFEKLNEPPKWATIVGLVGDVIYDRLTPDRRLYPCVYLSEYQAPEWFMSVMLRTKSAPAAFITRARDAVLRVNHEIPIYRAKTMQTVLAESFWERKFFGTLFTVFAGLALFLAAIGLYGVMAYSVRQRTQEIGVRMALGAQATDVLRLVTGQGMRLTGIGLAIGIVAAFFLTSLMQGSLERTSAHDPLSFGVVSAVLLVVGLLACYLPARSAIRLDPVAALHYE